MFSFNALLFLSSVPLFYFIIFCVFVRVFTPHTHSSRKQSSWRENATGSIPQSPSTPRPSPLRSRLTSTLRPRASPRQRTGPSPRQPQGSTSHQPRRHPQGRETEAAAGHRLQGRRAGETRRSRKNKGPFMRTLIQRTVLSTACLKTSRLKQIKPLQQQQQQHRVRLIYLTTVSTNIHG